MCFYRDERKEVSHAVLQFASLMLLDRCAQHCCLRSNWITIVLYIYNNIDLLCTKCWFAFTVNNSTEKYFLGYEQCSIHCMTLRYQRMTIKTTLIDDAIVNVHFASTTVRLWSQNERWSWPFYNQHGRICWYSNDYRLTIKWPEVYLGFTSGLLQRQLWTNGGHCTQFVTIFYNYI